jgi:hypothetical protein
MLFGIATVGKPPPLAWLNCWLAQYRPSRVPFYYACMYGGGELANNGDVQKLMAHYGYASRPTCPASFFQNAPGERPHQDIGAGLQVMLWGANLENKCWPFAFNNSLHISNAPPHGDRGVPFERFNGQRASVKKYRTFGCLVNVKPPDKINGKLESNFRRGFFLGLTGTLLQIYYRDLVSQRVKRAYTVTYDECSTVMDRPSPNSRNLREAMDGKEISADTQESGAPAVFDLVSSQSPFIKLKVLLLQVQYDHDTFVILSVDCEELIGAFICNMTPHSTGAALRGWRRNYADAYIVQLEHIPVFNTEDFFRHVPLLVHPSSYTIMPLLP